MSQENNEFFEIYKKEKKKINSGNNNKKNKTDKDSLFLEINSKIFTIKKLNSMKKENFYYKLNEFISFLKLNEKEKIILKINLFSRIKINFPNLYDHKYYENLLTNFINLQN